MITAIVPTVGALPVLRLREARRRLRALADTLRREVP